jgi:hypothetical protein
MPTPEESQGGCDPSGIKRDETQSGGVVPPGETQPPATMLASLRLASSGGSTTSSAVLFLDNITLAVTPEPSTYVLMLGGLAFLGFWLRRKNASLRT